jgi:hypothetical protein
MKLGQRGEVRLNGSVFIKTSLRGQETEMYRAKSLAGAEFSGTQSVVLT